MQPAMSDYLALGTQHALTASLPVTICLDVELLPIGFNRGTIRSCYDTRKDILRSIWRPILQLSSFLAFSFSDRPLPRSSVVDMLCVFCGPALYFPICSIHGYHLLIVGVRPKDPAYSLERRLLARSFPYMRFRLPGQRRLGPPSDVCWVPEHRI